MEYKPYELIKNAMSVIDDMKFNLQYSKNEVRDAKRINTLLDALKGFNDMLSYRYKTDAVDTLIFTLIHEYMLIYKVWENEIPIHTIVNNIDFAITNGSNHKKAELISLLKTHEMKNKIDNNDILSDNYVNFDVLLKDLLNQIKTQIKWSLIK